MANYTADEIRAFKLKDIMNCRMSALKAASTTHQGLADINNFVEVIKAEADEYFAWLRQGQDDVGDGGGRRSKCPTLGDTSGATLGQLPTPTLAQKKVLDAIAGQLNKPQADPQLMSDVLKWAEEVYNSQAYPTKLSSVEVFLKWYKTL